MRLVVFTPTNTKSAIGRMAAMVVREQVKQGYEVTVIRTESEQLLIENSHCFDAPIIAWHNETAVRKLVKEADACVYHIGNNFLFHEGGVRWLSEFPGVVCLHDFFLVHLFYAWAQKNRAHAESILENWYGKEAIQKFFSFNSSASMIEGTRNDMPMTEWICSQAYGVITHSQWGCDRVLNSCAGPLKVVPLAYDALGVLDKKTAESADRNSIIKILTIGHANPNKRIESVIQAIGLNPTLREHLTYRIVGAIEPTTAESLTALAKQFRVNLSVSGEVDDQELMSAISESDIICCLRWPTLEAASASAIEAMLCGKAVIVTDEGFYAEIPNDCAIKINHSNEINELQAALMSLLKDPSRIDRYGVAAKSWASSTFTAKNYANQMAQCITDISRAKPTLQAIKHFSHIMRSWSFSETPDVLSELSRNLEIFE